MNEQFLQIVLAAFEPASLHHQSAQSTLVSMRDTDINTFIDSICTSFLEPNQPERVSCLLLILSRNAFNENQTYAFSLTQEELKKYESALFLGMNHEITNIRYHSSISLGHYGIYCLTHFSHANNFFSNIYQNLTNDFMIWSFEISIEYILKQISISTEQRKQVYHIIFPRFCLETSQTFEKNRCLQIIRYLSGHLSDFLKTDEILLLFQSLFHCTPVPDFSFSCFSVWSKIANKNPMLLNRLSNLLELSLLMAQNQCEVKTKLEIFKFWIYVFYSDCELKQEIPQIIPQMIGIAAREMPLPSFDDSLNFVYDHVLGFLTSLLFNFPAESAKLLLPFIESNYRSTENPQIQYFSLVSYCIFLNTEFGKTIVGQADQMIQTALISPTPQLNMICMNIISTVAKQNLDLEIKKYLPLCMNFLKSGISNLENEASHSILEIVTFLAEKSDEPFNTFLIIPELFNMISPILNSSQISLVIDLIADLTDFVQEFSSIQFILKVTFQLAETLIVKPNDIPIGSVCRLFSSILSALNNNQNLHTECLNLLNESATPLFQFLVGIRNTNYGDEAILCLGNLSRSLKSDFQPMLQTAISIAIQHIDSNCFVRASISALYLILSSCNSAFAVHELVPRFLHMLNDENTSGQDYIVIFKMFHLLILLYFELISNYLQDMFYILMASVESLSEMNNDDEETACVIALNIFYCFSEVIQRDPAKSFSLLRTHLFSLLCFIIQSKNVDSPIVIAKIISLVLILANTFKEEIFLDLEQAHILLFLQRISLNCDINAKSCIEQIFNLCVPKS